MKPKADHTLQIQVIDMKKMVAASLGLLLAAAAAGTVAAQDFSWRGQLDRGQTLEVRGINGRITAGPASGGQVRVTAIKEEGRRGDMEDVTVEVVEHGGGITICAVYPSRNDNRPNRCASGDDYRMNVRDNDTRVHFEIEVPAGIMLVARTVNGDIDANDLGAHVEARTVNGDIDVSTAGSASANTVNGSITAAFAGSSLDDDLEFETVNGSIVLEIDGDVNADVTASTVNGRMETDFPLTISGRWGPRRLNGTIGSGGPDLSLSTVNGAIEIRRR
jgi:hypothetical protein